MSYQANCPQATQTIAQTQSIINANFTALNSFGNGYAELQLQSTAPSFSANNDGIYVLNNATTTQSETYIHIQRPSSATAEIPFTASAMSNTAAASCVNGWSYLPSGLLIKWGTIAAASNPTSVTPTVTSGGPNWSQVFTVYMTPLDTSGATTFACGQLTTPNNTSGNFTAYCANPSATTSIIYLVIGV